MKIAIVGVGGTGAAALRHLAREGHDVVGYEQFQVGHTNGSSHGETRIIRYTYPRLLYTQMMSQAYPLWDELQHQSGLELLVKCGGLYLGKHDDAHLNQTEQALIAAGHPFDKLTPSQAQDRFPAFNFATDEAVIFQKESGFLRAGDCVREQARLAADAGAEILSDTKVDSILKDGAGLLIIDDQGGERHFDKVIVTAGAWLGNLLKQFELPLKVTLQQVSYLDIARHEHLFRSTGCPVWIDSSANFYGFPQDGRIAGVKVASHDLGKLTNADDGREAVTQAYIAKTVDYACRRLPDLSSSPTHSHTCLYTSTPNEDFIIDNVPELPGAYLVSGCSGHGFKFTVLLGRIAADLALTGETSADISKFRLHNFIRE